MISLLEACSGGFGYNGTACVLCPPGTYSPGGVSSCVSVPAGFYNNNYGQSNYSSVCASSLLPGAASCESTTSASCSVGTYYNSTTQSCIDAPIGFYSPSTNSGVYYYCTESVHLGAAVCNTASSSCSSIGHFFNGTSCDIVPKGYYTPDTGKGVYYKCDYSYDTGAASCNKAETVCEPYNVTDTKFGIQNFSTCLIGACPGTTFTATLCDPANSGSDQFLVLMSSSGTVLRYNDDYPGCGSSSQLSYNVTGSECQTFVLREGCYDASTCSGTVKVTGSANCFIGQYFDGTSCQAAPSGSYSPRNSSGVYYYCSTALYSGAAICEPNSGLCLAGQYYSHVTNQCELTPPGYYNPIAGNDNYYYCSNTTAAGSTFCISTAPTPTPSVTPSSRPTVAPSSRPTKLPTPLPSDLPTTQPTENPTRVPTESPTRFPTNSPTAVPTALPTMVDPTADPTTSPTATPSTATPSAEPTFSPTMSPTSEPTPLPSCEPSVFPTANPTAEPTSTPSTEPTVYPSPTPTIAPTISPSGEPTISPSSVPTIAPTTATPTSAPSATPTSVPTPTPTSDPTPSPSAFPSVTPSTIPSSSPTAKPTTSAPSASPTYDATIRVTDVPKPSIVSVTPYATNVTIRVTLLPVIPSTAQLYCAAFRTKPAVAITAINLVKSAGAVTELSSYSTSATVTIDQLSALTDYYVYCYVQNVFGVGNSLPQVTQTKLSVTTACCNSISFTSAPTTIYPTVSKYATTSMRGKNIFTYALSNAPSSTVTVSCTLYNATSGQALSANYACKPSSRVYTSSSNFLSDRFFITGPSTVSISVSVGLSLSGSSASEFYSVAPVSVKVIASTVLPPAPKLLMAVFSSNGLYVSVKFDSDTNIPVAGASDTWPCNNLFFIMGSDASIYNCAWQSASTVLIQLPSTSNSEMDDSNLMSVGSVLYVLGNKLTAYCSVTIGSDDASGDDSVTLCASYPTTPLSLTTVVAPSDVLDPVPVIHIPSEHCNCEDLIVDVSGSFGSGGRTWATTQFTVLESVGVSFESSSTASVLEEYLNEMSSNSSAIVVPAEYLGLGVFSIQLTLINFLGGSASSVEYVLIHSSINRPIVSIAGQASISVSASEYITIESRVSLPSCATNDVYFQYAWNISSQSGVVAVSSTSVNPRKMILPPYALPSGLDYTVSLIVSSLNITTNEFLDSSQTTAQVFVTSPSVSLVVSGGYQRSPPIDTELVLDSSPSVVIGSDGMEMEYNISWSCVFETLSDDYGESCYIFQGEYAYSSSSSVVIPANTLSIGEIYSIKVYLEASDGSTDSKTITIIPAPAASPQVTLVSTFLDATTASKFSIYASVISFADVECTWSVDFSGSVVNVTDALTPVIQQISASDTTTTASGNGLVIPFAMAANVFTGRRSYTFSFSACLLSDISQCSYAQATVAMHSPPSNGYITSDPSSGTALISKFVLVSAGWAADIECYPLMYYFSTQLTSSHPLVGLGTQSLNSMLEAYLPAGIASFNHAITLTSTVTDSFSAVVSTTASITVLPFDSNESALSTAVDNAIAGYYMVGDSGNLYQVLNSVAAQINSINCTSAPSCSSLNRISCYAVPNTCGSCLDGYVGVVGPHNSQCQSSTAVLPVGSTCDSNNDCIYALCENSVCVAPAKSCPTNDESLTCSGHGVCSFEDPSGAAIVNCTISDTNCESICVCDENYYGSDCSLDSSSLLVRQRSRIAMCEALYNSTSSQDHSSELIDTLAGNLAGVYNPIEIVTYEGQVACLSVLSLLAELCKEGYIVDVKPTTTNYLFDIISAFSSISAKQWQVNASNVSVAEYKTLPVSALLATISNALSSSLVEGEQALTFTTNNVRVSVQNARLSGLQNISLSPPSSAAEAAYSTPQPSIQFGEGGISNFCSGSGNGYMQLSLTKWAKNPHPNSTAVKSPLLDISTVTTGTASSSSTSLSRSTTPIYFVVLQYSAKQSLNYSDYLNLYHNRTFPACSYFDGQAYVSCSGCNVSSFTDSNVTYACYDASAICSSGGSSSSSARRLQQDDDINDKNTVASYGMIMAAIGAELSNTLSINPFAIDLAKAKAVLIFVSLLLFVMVGGIVYFVKWDAYDHNKLAYLREERLAKKRAKREAKALKNVKNGGISTSPTKFSRANADHIDMIVDTAFEVRDKTWNQYLLSLLCCKCLNTDTPLGLEDNEEDSDGEDNDEDGDELGNLTDKDDSGSSAGSKHTLQDEQMKAHLNVERVTKQTAFGLTVIKNFMDETMPPRALLAKGDILKRFISALAVNHPYVCMLSHPSCMTTRTMRWLSVTRGILISLFIDTLFFGIFYPDDNTCPGLLTEESCLSLPSKIAAGDTLCRWDVVNETCSLAPPPGAVVYTMSISLLCVLINIPLDFVFGFLMDEYATRRPNLAALGLNSNNWLGTGNDSKIATEEELKQMEAEARLAVHYNSPLRDAIVVHQIEGGKMQTVADLNALKQKYERVPENLYYDYATPEEEVAYILNEVKRFWMDEFDNPLANTNLNTNDPSQEYCAMIQDAKAKALIDVLKVYPDGSPMPLTLAQWLQFGSAHKKLYKQIESVRKKATVIGEELQQMIHAGIAKSVNVFLLQHFILEQVSSVTRFALARQLFNYKELAPFAIDFWPWLGSWVAIFAMFFFFFYWIFSWGVVNGGTTLARWGINFVIGMVQDFCVVQPGKIFVLFIISVEAAKPQLRAIHRRLMHVTVSMLHHDELSLKVGRAMTVVQHTSAACRAARMRSVYEFPAAYILRELNDLDMQHCRERKGVDFGTVLFVMVAIPALIGLVNEVAIDNLMEVVLPSIFTAFVIVNDVLLRVSPAVLAIPYIVLAAVILFQFGILGPSIDRVKLINRRKVYNLQKGKWREAKRPASYFERGDMDGKAWLITIPNDASYFGAILTRLFNQFARSVVAISKPFFPRSVYKAKHSTGDSRLAKSKTSLNWQRMNIPAVRQGVIAQAMTDKSIDVSEAAIAEAIDMAERHVVHNRAVHSIPEPILLMIPDSIFAHAIDVYFTADLVDRKIFDVDTRFEDIATWKSSISSSNYQIFAPKDWNDRNELVGQLGADIKTSDIELALHAIFEYLIYSNAENVTERDNMWAIRKLVATSKQKLDALRSQSFKDIAATGVAAKQAQIEFFKHLQSQQQFHRRKENRSFPVSKYQTVIHYMWSIFYPAGIALSSVELEEVTHEFRLWLTKYVERSRTGNGDPNKVLLPFNVFESWFVSYVDEIIRYREWTNAHREPMIPSQDAEELWVYNIDPISDQERSSAVSDAEETRKQVDVLKRDESNKHFEVVESISEPLYGLTHLQKLPHSSTFFTMDWGVNGNYH